MINLHFCRTAQNQLYLKFLANVQMRFKFYGQSAQAAISSSGDDGLIIGAKALALTALDLFLNPEKLDEVKREFSSGL